MALLSMRGYFKSLLNDTITSWAFWLTIVFLVISIGIVAVVFTKLPPVLPIYNKMAWGYARLGATYEIFFPILLAFALFVGNIIFAKYISGKVPLLTRFLFLTSLSLSVFVAIFIVKLIFVVL